MAWLNNDGLYIKYGTEEAVTSKAGEFDFDGPVHVVEGTITLANLTSTAGGTILADNLVLPGGARIQRVELINQTAATSGGAATLNIGLARLDRSTELDFDGLVAAAALSTFDSQGERNTLNVGSTGAGALIGTSLANPGILVANYGTAAFTAGVVKYRIEWCKVLPT